MQNIIIRTPNFIGDTINTTPCLELIKQEYPDAKITVVGPDSIRDIFQYDKRITGYITFPLNKKSKFSTYWYILKKVRRQKGDLGVIFINTFISALLFKLAGIKCNIGYKNEGRGFLLDFKPKINRNKHYINRYASLFNEFIGNKYTRLPALYLPHSGKKTFTFDNDRKIVGFYPGGENKGERRYPENSSVELIKLLHQQGYNIVLIGDKNDNILHGKYAAEANVDNLINLTGTTTIGELIDTVAGLDILITIDSAALHIAAAVKTKFIGLMGLSTSPTSTITPKVDFGKILKIENDLIREEDYIKNITPQIILETMQSLR